jgi:hypothetical protein
VLAKNALGSDLDNQRAHYTAVFSYLIHFADSEQRADDFSGLLRLANDRSIFRYLGKDPVARIELSDTVWHNLYGSIDLDRETRNYCHLVQTAFALHQYRQKFGSYPESLNALVPEYLPRLPRDEFHKENGTVSYEQIDGEFRVFSTRDKKTKYDEIRSDSFR